jgi:hypothetical protein
MNKLSAISYQLSEKIVLYVKRTNMVFEESITRSCR